MQKTRHADIPPTASSGLEWDVLRLRELLVSLGRRASLRDPLGDASEQPQITAPQLHAVRSLGYDGALTMGELARRGGITEKTMTGIVDRLEQSGHVQRERDSHDRRLVKVRLTALGVTTFQSCDRHLTDKMRGLLALLDDPDRHALCTILEKLNDRLAARAAESAEETP